MNGGVREAIEIATRLQHAQKSRVVRILSLWQSPHELYTEKNLLKRGFSILRLTNWLPKPKLAILQLPLILWRFFIFWRHLRNTGQNHIAVFTHYASLPLAWFVPQAQRYVLVQDLEWRFVAHSTLSWGLKKIILYTLRRSKVFTVNRYLSNCLRAEGISIEEEIPIWADPGFLSQDEIPRDIDCVMVLRRGTHKRLDLYLSFIQLARAHYPELRLAAITPDDELAALVHQDVQEISIRPTLAEMRELYARSTCFLHLSEHEGFGLPPLEAMGAGCIPVCRDSGGIQSYMHGVLATLVIPRTTTVVGVLNHTVNLLKNTDACARWRTLCRDRFMGGPSSQT